MSFRGGTSSSSPDTTSAEARAWTVPCSTAAARAPITLLDGSGASARMIADQLGLSRVFMTQDVYLGRRAANAENVAALEANNPSSATDTYAEDEK